MTRPTLDEESFCGHFDPPVCSFPYELAASTGFGGTLEHESGPAVSYRANKSKVSCDVYLHWVVESYAPNGKRALHDQRLAPCCRDYTPK